jgi:FKBP-type peptidyl-prolyl cis-trans isomerase FkpA
MLARATRRGVTAMLSLAVLACGGSTAPAPPSDPATETYAPALGVDISQMTKVSDQLFFLDVVAGTGASATRGSFISTNYTGWLVNGSKFDSNAGKPPIQFTLGQGAVIPGWDIGISGMKVGGTRRLVIGSSLAYGSSGSGSIPPSATLVFDVQLVGVR